MTEQTHKLPCGALSVWEEIGYRCLDCLAIYGSIGCPCTREQQLDQYPKKSSTMKLTESKGGDFTPHPAGSFSAICCDIYSKEKDNKFYGKVGLNGKVDQRKRVTSVCIAFLTTEMIELKQEDGSTAIKPRYASFWANATWGSDEFPSAMRKFVIRWIPKLAKGNIADFDLEKLIGVPAWLTIIHKEKDGKTYGNVDSATLLPPGVEKVPIPVDFTRHKDKPENQGEGGSTDLASAAGSSGEDLDDLPF